MPRRKQPHKGKGRRRPVRRKSKNKRSAAKLVVVWGVKLFAVLLLFSAIFFSLVYLGFLGDVPTKARLHEVKNPLASEVFSAEGKLLGRYYIENRSNVRYEEISPYVINALIATEDVRFYEHRGIDEIALLRVFVKTILLQDRSSGGGSTISQQVAKNLFPRKRLGFFSMPANKLREAIIAYRLERIYGKDEILVLYLNTVPFGENIYGIEVASERFFNKSPMALTVDEAAVLVGMLKANNRYNPRINPELSKERRNVVIALMVKHEYLTEEEGKMFSARPLQLSYHKISYNEGPATYFLEMMRPELLAWCSQNKKENGDPYNLYTDGLKIRTTINYDFQVAARNAVRGHMKNLQAVFDEHWKNSKPWDNDPAILKRAITRTERYKHMKAAGAGDEEIDQVFKSKVRTTLFDWEGDKYTEITPLDSVKHYLKMLNAGFVAVDPSDGELKAWIGGIDFKYFKYDHVKAKRQPGSAFKPLVYLAALESGASPYKYYANERKVYNEFKDWSPRNSDNNYEGFYTMEGALARSVNTVSVELLMEAGIGRVVNVAHEAGIESELPMFPSLALGTASVSPLEMVTAFSTVVNGGVRHKPYYLVSIRDGNDKVLAEFPRPAGVTTSLNSENCRLLVHMLQAVVNSGTGGRIRSGFGVSGEFAGKTGTTQEHSDGWFIGVSPQLVTGCWVGADDPRVHFRSITYGQGAYMALPITGTFFATLYNQPRYRNMQYASFDKPAPEALASLDIPHFKEMLEREKIGGDIIDRIFAGNNKDRETLMEKRGAQAQKEKKNVWTAIKGIFGKKKKNND